MYAPMTVHIIDRMQLYYNNNFASSKGGGMGTTKRGHGDLLNNHLFQSIHKPLLVGLIPYY